VLFCNDLYRFCIPQPSAKPETKGGAKGGSKAQEIESPSPTHEEPEQLEAAVGSESAFGADKSIETALPQEAPLEENLPPPQSEASAAKRMIIRLNSGLVHPR
jgi:hypothetical protein